MNRIKILSREFTLEFDENLFVNHEAYGMMYDAESKIVVQAHLNKEVLEDTLLHECLHAIEAQLKMFGDEEEKVVIRLTTAILQLFRDNKELFKGVFDE